MDDHDALHKAVPRSCVETFLQLRHAALLDSVPRGPEHASVLRGTEPARQELRRCPAQCLADGILVFHSSNSDATGQSQRRQAWGSDMARRSTLGVGALRGRRPPSWLVEGAPRATEDLKPVMAPITRHAGQDGPTMRSL